MSRELQDEDGGWRFVHFFALIFYKEFLNLRSVFTSNCTEDGAKENNKYRRNLAVPGSEMYIVLMCFALRKYVLMVSISDFKYIEIRY